MDDSSSKAETGSFVPVNAEITKPRDFMINTAVHFLQNPRVQKSPLSQKRAFLIKKGLTNDEIDLAIEKSNIANVSSEMNKYEDLTYVPNQNPPVTAYRPSLWYRLNKIGTTAVILGVAFYGITQFYKLYIETWIFGNRSKDRIVEMEQQLLEVSRSLSQLKRSVASIEEAIGNQNEQFSQAINKTSGLESLASPSFFLELKADISTVKSLLLNRKQFPEAPKLSPTIPSWQMVNDSPKDGEINNENSAKNDEKMKNNEECADENQDSINSDLVETQYTFLTKSLTEEVIETLTIEEALSAQDESQGCSDEV